MNASFDEHATSYREEVDRAIAFAGKSVDHYARRKAEILVELAHGSIGSTEGASILDVGCGIGLVDRYLTGSFGSVAGVDLSEAELEQARSAQPGVSYLLSEPERIPHDDNAFDLTFAACVLHHVEPTHQHGLLAEMARVTRPGGRVVVFEHNPINPLTRLVVSRIEFDRGVTLLRSRTVVELLLRSGLHEPEARYITFFPWSGQRARSVERALRKLPLGAQYVVAAAKPNDP